MKKIIILFLIFYPLNALAKYEVVKTFMKKKFESHYKHNNNQSTWVDIETTTAAYVETQNNITNCPISGSRTTVHKTSKEKIQKVIGFFDCVSSTQIENKDYAQIIMRNGIIYYYKKDPRNSPKDIVWLIKSGVIKKNQNNPITNLEIYIQKDEKTTYSFYVLKSDVHYQNYKGYLNVSLSVNEKRRKDELEWYRMTKSKHFGLNQIENTEVKRLYDTLHKVENHFKKFDKKKFKPSELDQEIVKYLLSIKPSSEWEYISRGAAN